MISIVSSSWSIVNGNVERTDKPVVVNGMAASRAKVSMRCRLCGDMFRGVKGRKYCSDECQRQR